MMASVGSAVVLVFPVMRERLRGIVLVDGLRVAVGNPAGARGCLAFVEELFITALNFLIAIDNGRVILVGTDPR